MISLDIVIQSHLSDSLIEISTGNTECANNRIRFVKHLLHLRSNEEIGDRIDYDQLDELWKETVNSQNI